MCTPTLFRPVGGNKPWPSKRKSDTWKRKCARLEVGIFLKKLREEETLAVARLLSFQGVPSSRACAQLGLDA
jgi:hypothetical protein